MEMGNREGLAESCSEGEKAEELEVSRESVGNQSLMAEGSRNNS